VLKAHRSELEALIGAQLRAVLSDEERSALEHAEAAKGADAAKSEKGQEGLATVYPVMLTTSDVLSWCWSPAPNLGNDHEGVQAMAFVSETWALVVASKGPRC